MKIKSCLRSWSLFAAACCASWSAAWAASITNNDTGGALTAGASWVGGVVPGSSDVAVWATNISFPSSALGASTNWGGIQILSPSSPISITADGSILTLGASGIDMSLATNSLTLGCPLVLGGAESWIVTNGQTLTTVGQISGTGPLTINGGGNTNGTVVMAGFDTYTGNTIINGGTVSLNLGTNDFGTSGTVTLNGAGLFIPSTYSSGGVQVNAFIVNGTNLLDMNNQSKSVVFDGAFSGSGKIFITNDTASGSTLTFGGNGNGSGNFTSFTGSLIVTTNDSGTPTAGAIRFNNGGANNNVGNAGMTLDLGNGSMHFTEKNSSTTATFGAVFGGPNTELAQPENYFIGGLNITDVFGGTILGASSLTKTGTGTLILTNVSPYTLATTVSAGVLQIGDGDADGGLSGTSGVSVSSGASLIFNRPDSYATAFKISGAGATIITGGGINNYSGADTASGSTTIANGDLVLTGTMTGAISVAAGSTFDVTQTTFTLAQVLSGGGTVNGPLTAGSGSTISPGGTTTAGTLTISNGLTENGGVNNQFQLSAVGSTNDLIAVAGPLTVSGVNTITLSDFRGGTIPLGVYPVLTYTGALTGGANNFTVSAVGVTGTVTNITTVTPNEIAVIISGASRPATNLTWVGDGINNFWDNSSSNDWKAGATSFTFQAGDSVFFNDSGAPNTNVVLQATVLPAAVVVSNSTLQHYTFTDNGTGLGSIGGSTGLTKTNTGTLTILNTNTYTGPTLVQQGTLEVMNVANGGTASAIGAATSDPSNLVFAASTFRYSGTSSATDRGITNLGGLTVDVTNASTTLDETGLVTGTGALTKAGLGTLELDNVNNYAGGTVISNGILTLGANNANNNGAGGSGVGPTNNAVTFMGGTLQLFGYNGSTGNNYNTFYNPLVVPAGQSGTLQLFPRGAVNTGNGAGLNSSLSGGGTLNLVVNYVRDALSGNWSAFTGLINVTSRNASGDEMRINNNFGYSNASIYLNGAFTMDSTLTTGATIRIGELGGIFTAILGPGNSSAPNPNWSVGWLNTTNTFAGTIENDGVTSITKVGTGTWWLGGPNTYTGSTIISNGVLGLTNVTGIDASISSSANIFINTGAVLDLSGQNLPTLPLAAGQALSGSGILRGALDTTGGGTVSPGFGASLTGTLTVTNTVNLGGNVVMKLNYPSSDELVAGGAGGMTLGGTLTLTNIGGSIPADAVFTLFNAATFNASSFASINLPNYYTWDTSKLGVNGTVKVTSASYPRISIADFSALSSGSVTLNATNGLPGGEVLVLSSTNITLPLSKWTPIVTNNFDGSGDLNTAITVNPAAPQTYLIIEGF